MLKTKTITTDKATVLVVELLPKIKPETIRVVDGIMYYYDHIGRDGISVPKGNWQLLGKLPDIKEEQYSKIVNPKSDFQYEYKPSKEMFNLLLQANEVYFDNPYGKDEPKEIIHNSGSQVLANIIFEGVKYKWGLAQQNVWDKERCYLFIKAQ